MKRPFTISEHHEIVVVRWDDYIPMAPSFYEDALIEIVRRDKPVVFDFTETRTLGSRWYRILSRISDLASRRGHPLRIVFHDHLTEKAKFLGHDKLQIYSTLDAIYDQ